jgi:hypothetical protein
MPQTSNRPAAETPRVPQPSSLRLRVLTFLRGPGPI